MVFNAPATVSLDANMLKLRRALVGRDQRGAMTVAAIVVLALLFTAGAVLSLAVSADLHAVNLQTGQDQVHYTAESNVAQGTSAVLAGSSCPAPGPPAIECESPLLDIQQPVGQLVQPAQTLSCISVNLDSLVGKGGSQWAVWTVIGARGLVPGSSYDIWIATNKGAPCSYDPLTDSPVQTVPLVQADATYHAFPMTKEPEVLYVQVKSGQVALDPFVVRGALGGGNQGGGNNGASAQVITVIGRSTSTVGGVQSVIEADEADLYLPSPGSSTKPSAGLWRTVLP